MRESWSGSASDTASPRHSGSPPDRRNTKTRLISGGFSGHKMAGSTGLEPAASGVTGRRSNQLNYDPTALPFRGVQRPSLYSADSTQRNLSCAPQKMGVTKDDRSRTAGRTI